MVKSNRRKKYPRDLGVSPVITAVLLTAMVVMTFSVITVIVMEFTENSVPVASNVQFQLSADERILYHVGGDTLYMGNLEFRDRDGNLINELPGIDGAKNSWRGQTWSTGQYITADDKGRLIGSIASIDAKGNKFVIYRSTNILMDGSMVVDEFGEIDPFVEGKIVIEGGIEYGGDKLSLKFDNIKVDKSLVPEADENYYVYFKLRYNDGTNYSLLETSEKKITLESNQNGVFKGYYIGKENKDPELNFDELEGSKDWEVHVEVVHKNSLTASDYIKDDYKPKDIITNCSFNCVETINKKKILSWEDRP